jgi:hypothetical protein
MLEILTTCAVIYLMASIGAVLWITKPKRLVVTECK